MHVRVLAARQDGRQAFGPAAGGLGHPGLDGVQGRQGQRPGARILQHPMGAGQGQEHEGQVIEVRHVVDHRARVVDGANPKAIGPGVVADQAVQPLAGDGLAGGPAQGGSLGKDIGLAGLDARAPGQAGDRLAGQVQLLIEPTVITQALAGPQGQGLAKKPVSKAVLSSGPGHVEPGLGQGQGLCQAKHLVATGNAM